MNASGAAATNTHQREGWDGVEWAGLGWSGPGPQVPEREKQMTEQVTVDHEFKINTHPPLILSTLRRKILLMIVWILTCDQLFLMSRSFDDQQFSE